MGAARAKPLLAFFLVATAIAIAPARAGAGGTTVLGAMTDTTATCPDHCLVEARVSGFQASVGRRWIDPFITPGRGRIVSWSIQLGSPRRRDTKAFNRKFGEPKARLSVLKPVRVKRGRRSVTKYRLLRESPVERIRSLFGRTGDFRLSRPLKVGAHQVVALTVPTWAPAFALSGSKRSRWISSRAPSRRHGGCFASGGYANLDAGAPHQKLGSVRAYGCAYRGARLLYSATFVKRGARP